MERVSERAPLLIGVTGSRFFDRFDVEADRKGSGAFRARISACMAWLDRHFPNCPKVLLCGAAFGVDLVAAEAALAHGPHWSVAALLPFERALFAEDFAPDPDDLETRWRKRPDGEPCACRHDAWMAAWAKRYGEYRAAFERLMAADRERVLVRELPRLAGGHGPVSDAELSRASPKRDRGLRREHYEQVGLWIAESATVLFAYTSEPETIPCAAADGSTARVVAFRRVGRPDPAGLTVAAQSEVLRNTWSEVLRSHGRDVWLVKAGTSKAEEGDLPVTVLRRRSAFDHRAKRSAFEPTGGEGFEDEVGAEVTLEPLDTLLVPRMMERLHGRAEAFEAAVGPAKTWKERIQRPFKVGRMRWRSWRRPARPVADRRAEPSKAIEELRKRLGAVQVSAKQGSDKASKALAILFVLGLGLFEIFADLFGEKYGYLVAYLSIVLLSSGLVFVAGLRRWQPTSEDLRSVSEMLRVQQAWWAAGLSDRVDREHLQGVGRDLAHIPETVTTLLAWIWLKSGWRDNKPHGGGAFDWVSLKGRSAEARSRLGPGDRDWVGGQWSFFGRRIQLRNVGVHRASVGTFYLFAAAWWLAALLAILHWKSVAWIAAALSAAAFSLGRCGGAATAGALVAALLLAALPLVWRLRGKAVHRELRIAEAGRPRSVALAPRALGLPLLSAMALVLAAFVASPAIAQWQGPHASTDPYRWIALVMVAMLIAFSGAWRYVLDKSAADAEALEYRDAHRRFRLAEHALADAFEDGDAPVEPDRAQAIIRELGRLALVENEAWLKSRRERPLTML